MKSMKKLVAALLVLSMVLALTGTAFAASAKFTKDDLGALVEFKGSLYAYDKPNAGSRSNIIVKKGSVAQIVGIRGKKWVQVQLGWYEPKPLVKWFGVDKLAKYNKSLYPMYGRVVFASGGSNHSVEQTQFRTTVDGLVNRTVRTSGKVNLRKTASLKGKSYGTVKKGKKVKLTGVVGWDNCGVLFFQIKQGKDKYFISSEYVKDWLKLARKYLGYGGIM